MTPQQFIELTVTRMQGQILADIRSGLVDADRVAGFSDLHDFVDANCYGGMDEDEWIAQGNQLFPMDASDDPEQMFSSALMGAINAMQDEISAWIASDEFTNAVRGVAA